MRDFAKRRDRAERPAFGGLAAVSDESSPPSCWTHRGASSPPVRETKSPEIHGNALPMFSGKKWARLGHIRYFFAVADP